MLKFIAVPMVRTLVFTAVPLDVLIVMGPAVAFEPEILLPQPAATAAKVMKNRE
jgi:hypothetical protein